MFGCKESVRRRLLFLVGLAVVAASARARAEENIASSSVRVGVMRTAFRDASRLSIAAQLQPIRALVDAQTGLESQLSVANDADELGSRLVDGKVEFGVFYGHEFAWARQKYPELKPLVVTVAPQALKAYLVVRTDSRAQCCADLEGTTCAVCRQIRPYCRLFLEHCCKECGRSPQSFFAKITNPVSIEQALAAVVEGQTQATVVDAFLLEWYRNRRPEDFAQLKTIQQSDTFPAGVIAYVPGTVDEARLARFRDGLLNAHKNPRGEAVLTLCQIKRFDPVPPDYDQQLAAVVKAYPVPQDDSK
jgi:ABC-type phosphate/phosphonate transport system substrate-binding protein